VRQQDKNRKETTSELVKPRSLVPGRERSYLAAMKTLRLKPVLVAVFAAMLLAGCVETVREGKYATNPSGGWDNFRAQAPSTEPLRSPGA